MGVGQNYVLDKGFLATGATAYTAGLILKPAVGSGGQVLNLNTVAIAGNAATGLLVVCMEDLDTVRLATGKAQINCALLGLVRVQTTAVAITAGVKIASAANGLARAAVSTENVLGFAMTGVGSSGGFIDVMLTPGTVF